MRSSIKHIGDPVLRIPCKPFTLGNREFLDSLLKDMYEVMVAEQGVGLAANQIGHSVRIFILKDGDSYKEYINPEILTQEDLVPFEGEGCLSIPGASASTKRYRHLKLRWTDKDGRNQEGEFLDMQAYAVQHEIDHLNGKLYVDQLGPLKRELVLKKHKKYLKLRSK